MGQAISSGVAHRFKAQRFAYAAYHSAFFLIGSVSGVSTTPGASAFTRMPLDVSSTANPLDNWTRDALVAAYTPCPGSTKTERIDDIKIMLPPPFSLKIGRASCRERV